MIRLFRRRRRAPLLEANDLVATASLSTGRLLEVGDATDREAVGRAQPPDTTSPTSTIQPRQCVVSLCRGWFFDRAGHDRCAVCRASGDTS